MYLDIYSIFIILFLIFKNFQKLINIYNNNNHNKFFYKKINKKIIKFYLDLYIL